MRYILWSIVLQVEYYRGKKCIECIKVWNKVTAAILYAFFYSITKSKVQNFVIAGYCYGLLSSCFQNHNFKSLVEKIFVNIFLWQLRLTCKSTFIRWNQIANLPNMKWKNEFQKLATHVPDLCTSWLYVCQISTFYLKVKQN